MIADFIIDQMSRYTAGGMSAKTAAHFTRGELLAMYKGDHYSRDTSGAFQKTTPPEALTLEAATKKADAIITELLKAAAEETQKITHNAADKREPSGKAPENTPKTAQSDNLKGFEELADYRGYWWTQQ